MDRWRGRVALVTGASAGIGASIAEGLTFNGMKVVTCARRLEKLEEIAKEANTANHGGRMYPFKCDMSDTNNVQKMFEWIENHSELGRVDVCICNAALVAAKPLSEISPEEMKQMMDVNVISTSLCTQLSIKLMLKKGIDDGHIIFNSSILAHLPPPNSSVAFYTASKHALKVLLEGFRQELRSMGKNNIRIGSISPGWTKSEALEKATGSTVAEMVYANNPHLQSKDVSDAVIQMISAKPHVQIQDIVIRHVQETSAIPEF